MELQITSLTFQYFLMPIISSQLLLMVLLYFVVIYRGVLKGRNLFTISLAIFIAFLLCRSAQELTGGSQGLFLLYLRVSLLFSVGLPCLLSALFLQSKIDMHKLLWVAPYILGPLTSVIYVLSHDITHHEIFFSASIKPLFPFEPNRSTHRYTAMFGICSMLILPCLYLLYRQLIEAKSKITLSFLAGALCFGIFFLLSMFFLSFHWIYGIGAALLAGFWGWAVYLDINELKGKTLLLTEELNFLLRSGNKNIRPELRQMLENIELQSQGDIHHYKLKIRDILSLLTSNTIDAGGNKRELLDRNEAKIKAIAQSKDIPSVRELATSEMLELSEVIQNIPTNRSEHLVDKVKIYIREKYHEQFDTSDLAQQVSVSESYMRRKFKKDTKQTINQYLSEYRIEQAKILLATMSVTDTAFSVGFNDANYFSTVFKKITGLSPTHYQQDLTNNKFK